MHATEDFLLHVVCRAEHLIDFADVCEAFARGGDREDRIPVASLGKERSRSDESRDIVLLALIENAGNVIVDAVRHAHDAGAESVQVSADQGGLDS